MTLPNAVLKLLRVFVNLVKIKQEQDEKYFADGEIGHTFSSTQGTQSA